MPSVTPHRHSGRYHLPEAVETLLKTLGEIDLILQEAGPREDGILGVLRIADDRWTIRFEEVDVEVECNSETGRVLFAAVIGPPPPSRARAVYEALLSYTMLWRETGGVRMGLNGPAGEAVQMVELAADELDPALAAVVAGNLAARTLVWRAHLNDDVDDAEHSTSVDPADFNMIRI